MPGADESEVSTLRSLRRWRLISVVVPLLLFAATAWYDHDAVMDSARARLQSTADALAAHAEAVLDSAGLAVTLQLDYVRGMDWPTIDRSAQVHAFLARLDEELPQVASAFYVDPDGFNSASSRAYPMPRYDDHDREYFAAAKAGNTGLVVSAPFRGLSQGDLGFTVSRARVVDGRFDGVAAVTVDPAYFRAIYQEVLSLPEMSSALLLRRDGTVLARYPASAGALAALPADSPTMQAAAHGGNRLFEATSRLDGRSRIAALRWLPGHRLMVAVALDRGHVLGAWYGNVALLAALTLPCIVTLWITGGIALRRTAQEQNSLRALLAETARRQEAEAALQQAQKMDALGRLTGGVAHDFNNLLTAVLGSLELALRRVHDPTLQRLLNAATAAAQRGARLTAQMLAFSRKQALDLQPADANGVVRGLDELLRRSIGPLVRLKYQLAAALAPVLADRVQLEVALLNLVVNAHDAMPFGGEVTIDTRNVPAAEALRLGLPEREHVAIAVRDTGEGMTEAVRTSAFEPFFTTKEPGKGTGLGLSMVYGFARQSGGTVLIDSAPGQGTTVTICLPRGYRPATMTRQIAPPAAARESRRILLVDDDAAAREPTAALLREMGCTVIEADGGEAALRRLRAGDAFDLLLLDFAMPGMNGGQLATAARELHPALPVVFLTGFADPVLLERWQAAGITVVRKPFRLEHLAAALQRAAQKPAAVREPG